MDRKEIKSLLNYLETNREQLNPLQYEFFASARITYNATSVLTQRQLECLLDMREHILSPAVKDGLLEQETYRAQYSSFDHFSPYV